MPILHRRRRHDPLLPEVVISSAGRQRRSLRSHQIFVWRYKSYYLIAVAVTIVFTFYHFVLDEYAWVHARCLKTWFLFDTITQVECIEARTHKRATLDRSLWNLDSGNLNFNQTEAPDSVHHVITTPLEGTILDLALCSMEATARICQNKGCVVNVWIVDQAKYELDNGSWFPDMQRALESYQHCFRVVGGSLAEPDVLMGTKCVKPPACTSARALREWLASPLAQNQLPAHVSDAWRLVALYEMGGLYFDADVVPISTDVLHLPYTTVPAQNKAVGAYRLNGGVLRMNAHVCDSPKNSLKPTRFFDVLMRDHLKWAPRLARLAKEKQTFGFLGPCALTRVYASHKYTDTVAILPHDIVEPIITSKGICYGDTRPLAIHFSGIRKQHWRPHRTGSTGNDCWQNKVRAMCPGTFNEIDEKEKGSP
jgi:hypothetical protein